MAILDANLELADGATSTAQNAASTNVVDTLALASVLKDAWFLFRVDTAYVAQIGSPTVTIRIETSATETFGGSSTITLAQSAAFTVAELTAGKQWAIPLPSGLKRYVRGVHHPSGAVSPTALSTAVWDMYIMQEANIRIDRRYDLGQNVVAT